MQGWPVAAAACFSATHRRGRGAAGRAAAAAVTAAADQRKCGGAARSDQAVGMSAESDHGLRTSHAPGKARATQAAHPERPGPKPSAERVASRLAVLGERAGGARLLHLPSLLARVPSAIAPPLSGRSSCCPLRRSRLRSHTMQLAAPLSRPLCSPRRPAARPRQHRNSHVQANSIWSLTPGKRERWQLQGQPRPTAGGAPAPACLTWPHSPQGPSKKQINPAQSPSGAPRTRPRARRCPRCDGALLSGACHAQPPQLPPLPTPWASRST